LPIIEQRLCWGEKRPGQKGKTTSVAGRNGKEKDFGEKNSGHSDLVNRLTYLKGVTKNAALSEIYEFTKRGGGGTYRKGSPIVSTWGRRGGKDRPSERCDNLNRSRTRWQRPHQKQSPPLVWGNQSIGEKIDFLGKGGKEEGLRGRLVLANLSFPGNPYVRPKKKMFVNPGLESIGVFGKKKLQRKGERPPEGKLYRSGGNNEDQPA